MQQSLQQFLQQKNLLEYHPLFVFALSSEAAGEFEEFNSLIVGIGKVNAAYHLTKAIQELRPGIIINLGSAGSNSFKRGQVICCTSFIQRDMDVRGLGFKKYETPLSGVAPVLQYGLTIDGFEQGICGTGDSFEMAHSASDYNIIDMEAYPLALIAMKEQIPFLCLKYISDGADGMAADDWAVQVHNAAAAFKKIIQQFL
ncbi:5'-methylthioadenosine/S-adenosylhomocysteine nucleosidase family protein [Foetidibacter luteolus]|uniref:5'-methylthioadenosine/S-adenosylhomocysteine nucleosidase family protein n=1 Tax=Foetidibacter luteolus TaxID=2608880 RepID=UPI00129BFE41|nr:nucleosidase [Foetidibacter luteolus]